MKLASLFSGGKDSTFAIYKAKLQGHSIECLVSVFPKSDESHLLHYPNVSTTLLQAKAMRIPQITAKVSTDDTEDELEELQNLLKKAINNFGIEGFVHGGLFSEFQKNRFERVGSMLGLKVLAPLWHVNQKSYLEELVTSKFRFIITSVTSAGIDQSWLGKELTTHDVEQLDKLSSKHGFNLAFEGGEAETFVIDCPLFYFPIKIIKANKIWDGYRGRFEITEAILDQ